MGTKVVVVVGLGNTGSQAVPHLARMREVGRVVLVDPGKYDESNVETQAITPGEVGKKKTQVQGLRLKRINPALEVTTIAARVESVPLGRLRADAILACVDGRGARQYLNQASRHLGIPLVDSGVLADAWLARVSVYRPGPGSACLECGWDEADYDAVEQTYPCQPGAPAVAPTGAPAHLGALAAAVQVLELARLLQLRGGDEVGSHEIVIDADTHRQLVTRLERRTACRLADHDAWDIRTLAHAPEALTVEQLLAPSGATSARGVATLEVPGSVFVTRLVCPTCSTERRMFRLQRSLTESDLTCSVCRGRMVAGGRDVLDRLTGDPWPANLADRTLSAIGLEPGEVFKVTRGERARFYQLAVTSSGRGLQ
jgi:molybdopterin/thiamine biosynthesis adenylyltransferase